jgi:hypothetical protein
LVADQIIVSHLQHLAYEFKDVVRYKSYIWGYGRSRSYYHINFTMKAKGADDSNCGIDDLFFAEITINRGECIEMVTSREKLIPSAHKMLIPDEFGFAGDLHTGGNVLSLANLHGAPGIKNSPLANLHYAPGIKVIPGELKRGSLG